MRRTHRFRFAVLALAAGAFAACGETQDDLQYQTQLTAIQEQKTTLDVRFGVLTENAKTLLESGKPLRIRVAPNVVFTAVRESLRPADFSSIFWSGTLAGEEGWVSLLLAPIGMMAGVTSVERGAYNIQVLGNGLHALIHVDMSVPFIDIVGSARP